MLAHPTRNTEKEYPCTSCGGPGNIVREGGDPRLKCIRCNFMYNASDSIAAEDAGMIPAGPPKLQDEVKPTLNDHTREQKEQIVSDQGKATQQGFPKNPAYAFVPEEGQPEFCGKRDFKKMVLRWEHSNLKYKVYELKQVKVSANIQIT